MSFASIWTFTLRLQWEPGADFFLNHLLDGDPAANTLSWRWVGGLHTKGKTYLARPSNIEKCTDGRFDPAGQLALTADPLVEDFDHPFVPLSPSQSTPQDDYLLLVTSEDCRPESFVSGTPAGVLGLLPVAEPNRSDQIHAFKNGAVEDAIRRLSAGGSAISGSDWSIPTIEAAERAGSNYVVTPWVPIGPVATQLAATREALGSAGIQLHQKQRVYDTLTWPHATKGFFKLKRKIPAILSALGLTHA